MGIGIVAAIGAGIKSVCASIGGVIMSGISTFFHELSSLGLAIAAIRVVNKIVSRVAELFTEKPKEEAPEELGLKAKICKEEEGLTPDDFDSVQAYIEHLRQDIRVDKARLEDLSEEEREVYAAVGTGLYVTELSEKYGQWFSPEMWTMIYKTNTAPTNVMTLIESLKERHVPGVETVDRFFRGERMFFADRQAMNQALKDYSIKIGEASDDTTANVYVNSMVHTYNEK